MHRASAFRDRGPRIDDRSGLLDLDFDQIDDVLGLFLA